MPKDRPNRRVGAFRKTQKAIDYVVTHAGKFSGDAFRFANAGYASEDVLISGDGAMQHGGRWNPRGEFPATYLALDVETAWAEKLHSFRHYGLPLEHCLPACLVLIRVTQAAREKPRRVSEESR